MPEAFNPYANIPVGSSRTYESATELVTLEKLTPPIKDDDDDIIKFH